MQSPQVGQAEQKVNSGAPAATYGFGSDGGESPP
jgi:hypothetical protein